jgi:hypothetical protein
LSLDEQLLARLIEEERSGEPSNLPVPDLYMEYQLMKEMHWTFWELVETPAEVVNAIIRYMNTEGKFEKERRKQHG